MPRQVDSTPFYLFFSPINHFSQSSWKTTAFYSLFSSFILAKGNWSKSKAGAQRDMECLKYD